LTGLFEREKNSTVEAVLQLLEVAWHILLKELRQLRLAFGNQSLSPAASAILVSWCSESRKADRMDELLQTACKRETTEISSMGKRGIGRQYLCRHKALIAKSGPLSGR